MEERGTAMRRTMVMEEGAEERVERTEPLCRMRCQKKGEYMISRHRLLTVSERQDVATGLLRDQDCTLSS